MNHSHERADEITGLVDYLLPKYPALDANRVTDSYSYDAAANKWWGIRAYGAFTAENRVFSGSGL